ncbi:MAG: AbrB/MazE/SpoVT family DNA-binding domain-containing protein [Candidatus Methanoperedens sp.]|nr:AbrB/MazE/SpoVT family DNA-binding domain-containing protein [Candidatus Methanoperedens sp.]
MEAYRSKITSKGQITIPKAIRDLLHLLKGDEVVLLPTESGVILKRETASLRGIWKGKLTKKEIDEGIKEIRSKWRIDT